MNLISEIKKCVTLGQTQITFSKSGGYVSGVKRVIGFTREKIVFECLEGVVIVEGKNIELNKLSFGDAGFKGEITGVNFE